jgi:hypothetical protein
MNPIIEKISKLLALAGNNPDENEVASAMAKANDLLARHNLTMADVSIHNENKEGRRARTRVERTQSAVKAGAYKWQLWIWSTVADLNFCFIFTSSRHVQNPNGSFTRKKYTYVIGREHNVAATIAMASWLQRAVEDFCKQYIGGDTHRLLSRAAVSWKEGCSSRLISRISTIIEQKRAEENQTTALVLYSGNEQEENEAFVKDEMNITLKEKKTAPRRNVDWGAFQDGQRKGEEIHLGGIIA